MFGLLASTFEFFARILYIQYRRFAFLYKGA